MYYISQYGTDGFGHQLYGTMSLMALQAQGTIEFVEYIKPKQFEHSNDSKELNLFFSELLDNFKKSNTATIKEIEVLPQKKNNLNVEKISEICKNTNTLYVFDNAWSTKNIRELLMKYDYNILLNSHLPDPKFTEGKLNIVVHLRGGDARSREGSICKQDLGKLNNVLVKLQSENKNAHFYLHTNHKTMSSIIYQNLNSYIVMGEGTKVLDVFSHLVH